MQRRTCLEAIDRYSNLALRLEKRDLEEIRKLTEVLADYTRARAERFVEEHRHDTLLLQYGSDPTPLSSCQRYTERCETGTVLRKGFASHEYLVQRLFITDSDGSSVCVLDRPWILTSKTAFAHLFASRKFFKSLRELKHQGVHVIFHKYDRAIMTACRRLNRKKSSCFLRPPKRRLASRTSLHLLHHELVLLRRMLRA